MLMKICLVGDKSKTILRERFLGRGFQSKYMMTIGADFALHRMELDGHMFRFQIWDLAGQNRFRAVRSIYYLGTLGVVFVFDRLNHKSLEKIFDYWLPEVLRNTSNRLLSVILVGNRPDSIHENESNQITTIQGQEAARRMAQIYLTSRSREIEIPYIETSNETGINLHTVFHHLSRLYLQHFTVKIRKIIEKPNLRLDHAENLNVLKLLIATFGGICHGCRRSSRGLLCDLCFNMFKKEYQGIPASIFYLGNYLLPLDYRPILIGDPNF